MSAISPNVTRLIGRITIPISDRSLFLEVNLTWTKLQTRPGGIQNEPTRIWRSHVRTNERTRKLASTRRRMLGMPALVLDPTGYLRLSSSSSSQPRDPIPNPPAEPLRTRDQPVSANNRLQTKAAVKSEGPGEKTKVVTRKFHADHFRRLREELCRR
jgi:hypothetical protein